LLLEVMGSRQPILFVEGDRASLDYFIYGKVFPQYTIVPSGSCEAVIHSTRSFTAMQDLHHNLCAGLIDNDGRPDADVKMLNDININALPVALVENLFLVEPVLLVAAKMLGQNPAEIVPRVKVRVFDLLKKNGDRVISNLTRQEMETKLRSIGGSKDGAESISASFTTACSQINPQEIYKRWEVEIARVIREQDYNAALRYYKIKGLASEAGAVFGLKYHSQIMQWLRSEISEEFVKAIRAVLPKIEVLVNKL